MKRKEIKWRREGRGTMAGRQDGIIFRIFHPWDAPERGHTVSCYDTRGTGREISTAGYREFTWEEAVEFCQKIAAGEIDLEDLQAQFDAGDKAHAFFSTCMGRPLLSIEIKDGETGKTVSREVYNLDLQDLRDRGMVEEFVTAAERRRLERGGDNGGLSPAT